MKQNNQSLNVVLFTHSLKHTGTAVILHSLDVHCQQQRRLILSKSFYAQDKASHTAIIALPLVAITTQFSILTMSCLRALQMNMLLRLQEAANYSSTQSCDSDSTSHHDEQLDSSLESAL